MTLRVLPKSDVMAALIDIGTNDVLRACVAALQADAVEAYTTTSSPAVDLRNALEVKIRIAKRRGKTFIGDDQLLARLGDLGTSEVTIVFADTVGGHFDVYLRAWTLEPVAGLVMYDEIPAPGCAEHRRP